MFGQKPNIIAINGVETPINPDFRLMCEYSEAAVKRDTRAMGDIVSRFYFAGLPSGVSEQAAITALNGFYLDGLAADRDKTTKSVTTKEPTPSFSFSEDECYFYADFLSHYRIDLNTANIHWFDFCALFKGLPDECKLKRIIGVRSTSLSDIKSEAEKKRIRRLKRVFALKSQKARRYSSVAERDAAIKADFNRRMEEVKRLAERGDTS